MKAVVVTIGDEILIGQIVDTNSAFIADKLDKVGVSVVEMISISDSKSAILGTFSKYQNKVDLVVITGGLGPTKDDITKKTWCEYFKDKLICNNEVLIHVTQLIEKVFNRPITQLNKDQALVPSKANVLFNEFGTAPGLLYKKDKTTFVSLPGVPYEMKNLVENKLIPYILKTFKRPIIIHRNIIVYGIGESLLAEKIETWEDNLPESIKLAYLPSPGRVKLRLTGVGVVKQEVENLLNGTLEKLKPFVFDMLVDYEGEENIVKKLAQLLIKNNFTIATAESCTGGKIVENLTHYAGSSQFMQGGMVVYSNEQKVKQLGVSANLINEYGVVSKEVAVELVKNVKMKFGVNCAIATTGNAGPSSCDASQEVGKVFVAVICNEKIKVEEFNFGQPREKVIERATIKGFELLIEEILKN